jgi:hypothetical protein
LQALIDGYGYAVPRKKGEDGITTCKKRKAFSVSVHSSREGMFQKHLSVNFPSEKQPTNRTLLYQVQKTDFYFNFSVFSISKLNPVFPWYRKLNPISQLTHQKHLSVNLPSEKKPPFLHSQQPTN